MGGMGRLNIFFDFLKHGYVVWPWPFGTGSHFYMLPISWFMGILLAVTIAITVAVSIIPRRKNP